MNDKDTEYSYNEFIALRRKSEIFMLLRVASSFAVVKVHFLLERKLFNDLVYTCVSFGKIWKPSFLLTEHN